MADEELDAEEADEADDGSDLDGGLFALTLAWPITHAIVTPDGILWSTLVGVGGSILMFMGMAIAAGMVESSVGRRRSNSVATALSVGVAAIYWFRNYPGWAALSLIAVGALAVVATFRSETRRVPTASTLPGRIKDVEDTLPKALPDALAEAVDQARRSYLTIRRYAEGELADEAALEPDRVVQASEASLVAIFEQVRRLYDMRESDALVEAAAAGRARLDAKLASLQSTRDQLLIYAQEKAAGRGDALAERATSLRLTVTALRELQADE